MSIPEAEIVGLQFGLMADADTERVAVKELTVIPTNRKTSVPVIGSMNCTSLGTTASTLCTTCGGFFFARVCYCVQLSLFPFSLFGVGVLFLLLFVC